MTHGGQKESLKEAEAELYDDTTIPQEPLSNLWWTQYHLTHAPAWGMSR